MIKEMNNYIDTLFCTHDPLLEEVVSSIHEKGMPSISVSPSSGKLLTMLVTVSGAKNILEIGALGGYSGICLARGLEREGTLTSLELKEDYAAVAEKNLTKAGFGNMVSYMIGPALQNLEKLKAKNKKFDFFFVDADKENYANYLELCITLAEPGALIVCDNVLAGGSVVDPNAKSKRYTDFMKEFNSLVASHPKLESLLIPLGDGMNISRVRN